MAIDDKGLKIVEGFYFPEGDTECSGAVFNELWKLDKLPSMGRKCVVQAAALNRFRCFTPPSVQRWAE